MRSGTASSHRRKAAWCDWKPAMTASVSLCRWSMTGMAWAKKSATASGSPIFAGASPHCSPIRRGSAWKRWRRMARARPSSCRMSQRRQLTALIAEDEPMLRAQLRARLGAAWPELAVVADAENGDQALALQRELLPDIAFLDIRMPVKSGLEVAEELGGACHVVFVTAYDQYAVAAFEQGAIDYVLKPVTAERMSKVVERLKQRLDRAPADLTTLLSQLNARETGG